MHKHHASLAFTVILAFILAVGPLAAAVQPPSPGEDTTAGHPLYLKAATFVPGQEAPPLDPVDMIAADQSQYFIIQFDGPVHPDEIQALRTAGATPVDYIPEYAYVAHIDPATLAAVQQLPFVTWTGPYHPGYKHAGDLAGAHGTTNITVKTFEQPGAINEAALALQHLGGQIHSVDMHAAMLTAAVDAALLPEVARIPQVAFMERTREKYSMMDTIRVTTGVSALHLEGYNGTGIVGEVKDNGYDSSHPEFAGQILAEDGIVTQESHGTCTFGIVFASGIDQQATGMLPGAQGVFCDWDVPIYASVQNLVNSWNGVFQSNSWGYTFSETGEYETESEQSDQAVYDMDATVLYAAGNRDYGDYITTLSAAKNVISVGGIYHYDTQDRGDDEWNGASCYGPAADGRIKPDLTGPYDHVYTTDVVGAGGYAYGDYYASFGGTSAATPVAAGAAGLVYQLYGDNHYGNNPNGSMPHAATVKALLINHAYQYPFSQATRYQQGWGYPDVQAIYQNESDFIVDGNHSLSTGESVEWNLTSNGSQPLKASLVWTDVPGAPSASKHLKNDLSLKVIGPNNTVYWGNHNLTSSRWSSPGGTEDHANNVENVFIQHPAPGQYQIRVIGANVPEPAADPAQDFSLVVSGATHAVSASQSLQSGWNLITVPVANGFNASSLGAAIPNCEIVAYWNASTGMFQSYVVGVTPGSGFAIEDGVGYFVYVNTSTMFSVTGVPLSSVAVDLYQGWNTIGWFGADATNASSLASAVPNCSIAAYWNASSSTFESYTVGVTPPPGFAITQGMGVFVYVTAPGTWTGQG